MAMALGENQATRPGLLYAILVCSFLGINWARVDVSLVWESFCGSEREWRRGLLDSDMAAGSAPAGLAAQLVTIQTPSFSQRTSIFCTSLISLALFSASTLRWQPAPLRLLP